MSLARSNIVLQHILEFLMAQMGRSNLSVRFEDFGIPEEDERFFDGMATWALREGLISLQSSKNLLNAHTDHSYAELQSPAITSFGMAAYAYAMANLSGNILQATALMKNAEHFGGGGSGGGRAAGTPRGASGLERVLPAREIMPGAMHAITLEGFADPKPQ